MLGELPNFIYSHVPMEYIYFMKWESKESCLHIHVFFYGLGTLLSALPSRECIHMGMSFTTLYPWISFLEIGRILCQLFKCGKAINPSQNNLPFICLAIYVGLVDDKILLVFYYLAKLSYHLILGPLFWNCHHLKALPYSKVQSQWHY